MDYTFNEVKLMKANTPKTAAESVLNVPLCPETRRNLERVSCYNSRTLRRQAALYIDRCARREVAAIDRRTGK